MSPGGNARLQPLTPPPSGQLESQYLVPSNSASPYPPIHYELENIPHMTPHSQTTFSSPESRQVLIDPYDREPYGPTFHGQEPYHGGFQGQQAQVLDVPHTHYGGPMYIQPQTGPYIYPAPQQLYPNPLYPALPPPPPAASNPTGDKKEPRKTSRTTTPSTRAAKANKKGEKNEAPRKASKGGKQAMDKSKIPKLTSPLSELTKKFDHIPIKDMHAWINRPKEIRVTEKGKGGRVPRPMNSFMLYRSAYAERCKVWCSQNNHQVVSTVCGESWALEPPEIKQQFADYAQVERDNHAKAHPDYKFSPTKSAATGRKRKRTAPDDEDEEEPSDLDDPDFEYRPSAAKEGKKRAKSSGPVSTFPPQYPPQAAYIHEGENGRERSSYQYNNPGKPLPLPLGSHGLPGKYYETTIVQNSQGNPNVEDVLVRRTDGPGVQYGTNPPVVALPNLHHYELMDKHPTGNSGIPIIDAPLDPLLSQYDAIYHDTSTGFVHDQNFEDFGESGYSYDGGPPATAAPAEGYPATADSFPPNLDDWQYQQTDIHNGGELEEDFDDWMKRTNNR